MWDGSASGQGLCAAVPNPCLFYDITVIVKINLTYYEMICSMLLKRTGHNMSGQRGRKFVCRVVETMSDRLSNKNQPFYLFTHYLSKSYIRENTCFRLM